MAQLDTSSSHACAVSTDGRVYCWGSGQDGALGAQVDGFVDYARNSARLSANFSEGGLVARRVAVGQGFSIVLTTLGRMYGMGGNSACALGDPAVAGTDNVLPIEIAGLGKMPYCWSQVEAGRSHVLALTTGGRLFAWGANEACQLGLGSALNASQCLLGPPPFDPTLGAQPPRSQVSRVCVDTGATADGNYTCRRSVDAADWCWKTADAGHDASCAIVCDSDTNGFAGRMFCWGSNTQAKLGLAIPGLSTNASVCLPSLVSTSGLPAGDRTWAAVSVGKHHICGITSAQRVACWGDNSRGALGRGYVGGSNPVGTPSVAVPSYTDSLGGIALSPAAVWRSVDAGDDFTCAASSPLGIVYCWGRLDNGRLGVGRPSDSFFTCYGRDSSSGGNSTSCSVPSRIYTGSLNQMAVGYANPAPFIAVSTGEGFACAIGDMPGNPQTPLPVQCALDSATAIPMPPGSVFCFGSNYHGEAGTGSAADLGVVPFPEYPVSRFTAWQQVSPGHGFTCGIARGGWPLACWGDGRWGQLGNGRSSDDSLAPIPVFAGNVTSWRSVAAGLDVAAAVSSDGRLWTWGLDARGKLGRPAQVLLGANAPGQVRPDLVFTEVSGAYDHFLALTVDQQLFSWGNGQFGRLGTAQLGLSNSVPTRVNFAGVMGPTGDRWKQCSAGGLHSCCVTNQGLLACWGLQSRGRLGNGQAGSGFVAFPMVVGQFERWSAVSAGADHTLALTTQGQLYAFGDNAFAQLGLGFYSGSSSHPNSTRAVPTLIFGGETFTSIAAGARFSLATTDDGILRSWGSGETSIGRGESEGPIAWPVAVSTHLLPVGTRWHGATASAEGLCAMVTFVPATAYLAGTERDIGLVDLASPLACISSGRFWNGIACVQPFACTDPTTSFDGFSCEQSVTSVVCADEEMFWDGTDCITVADVVSQSSPEPLPSPAAVGDNQAAQVPASIVFTGINVTDLLGEAAQSAFGAAMAQTLSLNSANLTTLNASNIIVRGVSEVLLVGFGPVSAPIGAPRRLQAAGGATQGTSVQVDFVVSSSSMVIASQAYQLLVTVNTSAAATQHLAGPLLALLQQADPVRFRNAVVLSISPQGIPRVVVLVPPVRGPEPIGSGTVLVIVIGAVGGILVLALAAVAVQRGGCQAQPPSPLSSLPPVDLPEPKDAFAGANPLLKGRRRSSGGPRIYTVGPNPSIPPVAPGVQALLTFAAPAPAPAPAARRASVASQDSDDSMFYYERRPSVGASSLTAGGRGQTMSPAGLPTRRVSSAGPAVSGRPSMASPSAAAHRRGSSVPAAAVTPAAGAFAETAASGGRRSSPDRRMQSPAPAPAMMSATRSPALPVTSPVASPNVPPRRGHYAAGARAAALAFNSAEKNSRRGSKAEA